MVGWIMRPLMFVAAIITGWFVSPDDTATFDVFQMAVATVLIAFFVSVAAFWPSLARRFKSVRAGQADRASLSRSAESDPRSDDR
jgi:hypothetical protein